MTERRFRRDIHSLASIVAFVNEFLAEHGKGADAAYDVHLIIEELFTNMVKYSRESTEDVAIALEWNAPTLSIRLRDSDVDRFDLTQRPPVDVSRPISERRGGGLGIHFVQQLADSLEYDWTDRVSTIRITKRLGA